MTTLRVDAANPDPDLIARAAAVITSGGLVVFPTETVYGLGVNALDEGAAGRVFEAKGRDRSDPLIVHIASIDDIEMVAREVPLVARQLASVFWPGPLSMVLPRGPEVAAAVSAGLPTVAVRVPDHAVALALLRASAVPIAAPSANQFKRTSPTTAEHVLGDLGDRVDLVLDGGPTVVGIESTVVAFEDDAVVVLRPGGVTLEALADAVPGHRVLLAGRNRPESPGQLDEHYAPLTQLILLTGPERYETLRRVVAEQLGRDRRIGLLAPTRVLRRFRSSEQLVFGDLGEDPVSAARQLYAAMRALDGLNLDAILAVAFEDQGLGLALNDRLRRAARRTVG